MDREPLRRNEERRLPALSSLRGHRPAQDTRWAGVGKRLMSKPISDRMTLAATPLTPGMWVSRATASRKGSSRSPNSLSISAMPASIASAWARCKRSSSRW